VALLHGDDDPEYGEAGYKGIAKTHGIAGNTTEFRVEMRPGKAGFFRTHQLEGCRI
jgi:hypothetical protein